MIVEKTKRFAYLIDLRKMEGAHMSRLKHLGTPLAEVVPRAFSGPDKEEQEGSIWIRQIRNTKG